MSDTIQVELPKDVARRFADIPLGDGDPDTLVRVIRDKVAAALPPEYPEGTVAWVTDGTYRYLADFCKGKWRAGGTVVLHRTPIKVEPIRVLADDEIAVKRPNGTDFDANDVRGVARRARDRDSMTYTAAWLESVADALDAEQE